MNYMKFEIPASKLRNDYLNFMTTQEHKPWQVYLCLFMEQYYGLGFKIDDNFALLEHLDRGDKRSDTPRSSHGVQGFVTHKFAQRMVDAGTAILAWPHEVAHADHFDWTITGRIAFRVGLLSYIIEKHGDIMLSFTTDIEEPYHVRN